MAQYSRKLKKGLRYYYKFDLNGKTYFSKCIYPSKSEARKAENAKYEEVSQKALNPSLKPILSLGEAIDERLDYVKAKKSAKYYYDCKKYYKELFSKFGDVSLEDISRADINRHLLDMSERLKAKGKDNYSVNAALRVYKALFNYVIINRDLGIKNPCYGISLFSIKRNIKYIPTRKEIEDVIDICDVEERFLILFIEHTGARVSEALRIMGSEIFNSYVILKTRKSRNSDLVPRRVPISIALPVVSENERLFKRWSNRPQFLEIKVKKLGHRSWNFHNLRHRRASIWANIEKRPLYEVMSLLGHKNLSTTQGYLQMLDIVADS